MAYSYSDYSYSSTADTATPYGFTTSRSYKSGWSRSRGRADTPSTIRDTGYGSAQAVDYSRQTTGAGRGTTDTSPSDYESVKAECLRNNKLWEDPHFLAGGTSIYYNVAPAGYRNIEWKRPHQICTDPQLFVDGATRMDVNQGVLGDCWLLAAVASLSTNEKLLYNVVPPDQSFKTGYAGVFRFRFWQYGRWVEVLVDDRLPTQNNKLMYMHSDERNEFWSALLEKAYAKLNGSYEALSGGLTSEALTDFTGGLVERYELRHKAPPDLFQSMSKAQKKGSLMGCSIDAPEGRMEAHLPNGLIIGHAYSITDVRLVTVNTGQRTGQMPMVRVRNPWGDSHEWKGAWSDSSSEWQLVPEDEKKSCGLTFDHDGEFWMAYKDFSNNFERLEICYLGPDSLAGCVHATKMTKWEGTLHEGSWRRRVNAGGCRNYPSTFWTNPQYRVSIEDPDSEDDDGNGSVIVELMQKERRKLRKEGKDNLTIGYAVYKLADPNCGTLDKRYFDTHTSSAKSSTFSNLRQVSDHHKLPPGHYVVVPSTFEPYEEGDFLLRIFSEKKNTVRELDDSTTTTVVKKEEMGEKTAEDKSVKDQAKQEFLKMAGADQEIDAFELQDILNKLFQKEFKCESFNIDMTRSMVAMKDADMSGKLDFQDFQALWKDLILCKKAFVLMDTDKSGHFNSYEFKNVLNKLGFRISNATYSALVIRYSDKDGHVGFNDFVACYIKLKTMFDTFKARDRSGEGRVSFNLDEFAMLTMYS